MNVRERRIRRADTDDINLVSAFDEELGSNERKEAVRCATEGKNAYVLEQDHRVIAVGILEYTFFQQDAVRRDDKAEAVERLKALRATMPRVPLDELIAMRHEGHRR